MFSARYSNRFQSCFSSGPLRPLKIDLLGTNKLVDAAIAAGVPKLVLVSSLLTNGLEAGQALNRNYILLNLFGGVFIAKFIAER